MDEDEFEFVVNERDMAFEAVAALVLAGLVFVAAVLFVLGDLDDNRVTPPSPTTQVTQLPS